ncbi:hypothetical protein LINGRAHAP2_LOCUS30052 [Linum grandiflorum]
MFSEHHVALSGSRSPSFRDGATNTLYRDAGGQGYDPSRHDSTAGVASARDDGAISSTVGVAR